MRKKGDQAVAMENSIYNEPSDASGEGEIMEELWKPNSMVKRAASGESW